MPAGRSSTVREARTPVQVGVVVADYILVALVNIVFVTGALTTGVTQATGGLINRTLLGNLPLVILVIGVLVLGIGRLRPRDIGLVRSKVAAGLAITLGLWASVQIVQSALALAIDGAVEPAPAWASVGAPAVIGLLVGQLLGNALYEDLAYRGFLFPQVRLKLERRQAREGHGALVAALVASQILFALRHIPGRVLTGTPPTDIVLGLIPLTLVGILLALLYLRTDNLFLVIGVHALIDAPTALVNPTLIGPSNTAVVLAVLLLIAWPRPRRARKTLA